MLSLQEKKIFLTEYSIRNRLIPLKLVYKMLIGKNIKCFYVVMKFNITKQKKKEKEFAGIYRCEIAAKLPHISFGIFVPKKISQYNPQADQIG